jgi:hypothetical protein
MWAVKRLFFRDFKFLLLWYGKSRHLSFSKILRRSAYRRNLITNKTLLVTQNNLLNTSKNFYFYVPSDWHFVHLSGNKPLQLAPLYYLYSKLYYFKLPIQKSLNALYFSQHSNVLCLMAKVTSPLHALFIKTLASTFLLFSKSWFLKLKIKGKGYYIYKNTRNTVTHQFGHSHRVYLYLTNLGIKFLSKTTIIIFGISKHDLLISSRKIFLSKPLNIFTGRGVRFSKQIIYKKTGKVSSYR